MLESLAKVKETMQAEDDAGGSYGTRALARFHDRARGARLSSEAMAGRLGDRLSIVRTRLRSRKPFQSLAWQHVFTHQAVLSRSVDRAGGSRNSIGLFIIAWPIALD